MKIDRVHLVYFSATFTTRKVVRAIGAAFGGEVVEYDITCGGPSGGMVSLGSGDLLVAGVPVYAGRVPAQAAVALRAFKGSGVPAVLVCVYGNRDYDDALVELQDIVGAGGFKTVAAGAFIARHCIFPKVAADRPDAADMQKIDAFAAGCARLLAGTDDVASLPTPVLKGSRPYKQGGASTFSPVGDASLCDGCQACVRQCPVGAIPTADPCSTDASKCIACGRCLVVCHTGSRAFRGDAYKGFEAKFIAAFSARREPEVFLPAGV